MSYMGLFWETGMPEAWALSRKSDDKPEVGAAEQAWPQASVDLGTFPDPVHRLPGDSADRPASKPGDGKTKN